MAESGWGGMNRGTFRMQLTGDILFALFFARLTGPERIIVAYVLKESWGASIIRKQSEKDPWPDPVPCPLNLSAIAKETEADRPELSKAKAKLLKDNILMPLDGGFTLNKDVDSWAEGRIEPGLMERARAEQNVKHPRPRQSIPATAPVEKSTQGDVEKSTHPPCGEISTVCGNPHTPCVEIHTPPVEKSTHPPIDSGRSKTHASARAGEEDFSSLPELNSKTLLPPPTLEPRAAGVRLEKPPETLEELQPWVAATFGVKAIPPKSLESLAAGFRPSWVFHALRLASMDPEVKKPAGYADAVLQKWRKQGFCDAEAKAGSDCRYVPPDSGLPPGAERVQVKAFWFNGKRYEKRA